LPVAVSKLETDGTAMDIDSSIELAMHQIFARLNLWLAVDSSLSEGKPTNIRINGQGASTGTE
jgi:hypothetical protein